MKKQEKYQYRWYKTGKNNPNDMFLKKKQKKKGRNHITDILKIYQKWQQDLFHPGNIPENTGRRLSPADTVKHWENARHIFQSVKYTLKKVLSQKSNLYIVLPGLKIDCTMKEGRGRKERRMKYDGRRAGKKKEQWKRKERKRKGEELITDIISPRETRFLYRCRWNKKEKKLASCYILAAGRRFLITISVSFITSAAPFRR